MQSLITLLNTVDCQVAAVAAVQTAVVANRNVGDFGGCGIEVIDQEAILISHHLNLNTADGFTRAARRSLGPSRKKTHVERPGP